VDGEGIVMPLRSVWLIEPKAFFRVSQNGFVL
jgi:hypothetical protein